jgi:hypothetical protein
MLPTEVWWKDILLRLP